MFCKFIKKNEYSIIYMNQIQRLNDIINTFTQNDRYFDRNVYKMWREVHLRHNGWDNSFLTLFLVKEENHTHKEYAS